MSAHLSEEEQIESIKRWWKENGKFTVAAVVVAAAGYLGWNGWQNHKQEQAEIASAKYEEFVKTVSADDDTLTDEEKAAARQTAEELLSSHDETMYADFAALYLAKLAVEEGNGEAAADHLRKVMKSGSNESVQKLARLRLARVMASQEKYEDALGLLENEADKAYAADYAETRGDILLMQNRLEEAGTAYRAALEHLGNQQPMRRSLVQLKFDNTLVATKSPGDTGQNPHGVVPSATENPAPEEA